MLIKCLWVHTHIKKICKAQGKKTKSHHTPGLCSVVNFTSRLNFSQKDSLSFSIPWSLNMHHKLLFSSHCCINSQRSLIAPENTSFLCFTQTFGVTGFSDQCMSCSHLLPRHFYPGYAIVCRRPPLRCLVSHLCAVVEAVSSVFYSPLFSGKTIRQQVKILTVTVVNIFLAYRL